MAFSSLLRSAPSPVLDAGALRPSDRSMVSRRGLGSNVNSVKFQSSISGANISVDSFSTWKSATCSTQPIKATATEIPPTIPKSRSSGKTKVGINGPLFILSHLSTEYL
ncbi:glyceraldehyde-3-phosphate dehydrogenase GAPCP2, chloroplastic [Olea europaea subsp. europaea]|uniref:Glyceraldehyde-3-phosphate dehydrogenase GAPCP2, chloroplastic n=1 Tax=Olea europaea subsp. europaea TaxID=158383 RepID=A0A8S0R8U7_OLEEU|nr:glyceraldehyde-3-phosphate dehydrogenase GAPCP2, chloroplastic [Olea europaea subsp. europaea]